MRRDVYQRKGESELISTAKISGFYTGGDQEIWSLTKKSGHFTKKSGNFTKNWSHYQKRVSPTKKTGNRRNADQKKW